MSSGKAGRGELPPKKGAQDRSSVKNAVNSKGDVKSEKVDLTPKILPTAEQMQIARIIDSHRPEDPELQRKIRQVMEITRTTEDKASMALHSRENNVEEAITLLTEGGSESLESEWEQAGKKRKPKTAAQKSESAKDLGQKKEAMPVDKSGRDRSEKRLDRERESRNDRPDRESGEQLQGESSHFESRRGGGGRSRGPGRGGRGMPRGGRVENNKENDETNGSSRSYPSKYANGPGRGGRGRGGRGGFRGGDRDRDRDSGRTFASRTRGGPRNTDSGDFASNTIDVWENSQADSKADSKGQLKVEKWDEFPSAEDWDNEEYTGSLTESKVFTPSTQPQNASLNSAPIDAVGKVGSASVEPATNGPTNHLGASSVITGQPVVAGQSIDLQLLLNQPQNAKTAGSTTNAGANILASIQSSYSSAAAQQIQPPVQQQPSLPQRHKVQSGNRARVPQPSGKLPSTGVEMPDESITKLDVQFGGLDFGSPGSGFSSAGLQNTSGSNVGAGGDMMFSQQSNSLIDSYSTSPAEKQEKSNVVPHPNQQAPPSPFQNQRAGSVSTNESLNATGKSVPISPSIDSLQKSGTAQPSTQQSQHAAGGSAFVPFNTKPAPGFSAPGFPAVSQTSQAGTYGNVPTYGSQQQPSGAMLLPQQQSGYHGIGLSSYGTQPIVSTSVQPSQGSLAQLTNSGYGAMPGHILNPYQSSNTIPSTTGYASSSTYASYAGVQKLPNSLSNSSGKESVSEVSGQGGSASSGSAQLGTAAVTSGSKLSSQSGNVTNVSSNSTGNSAGSKLQSSVVPPGMMLQPSYILNQGVPMYSFQGPMYGYDENQLQFLPRPLHPAALAAGYYEANATNFGMSMPHELHDINTSFPFIAPGGVPGTGRSDGSSIQTYPGADSRFPRTDSSTASPVPSNLPGQTSQQPMYNLPQGTPYYYLGNTNPAAMMHSAFPYGPPPALYPSTAMQITSPTNPSTGAPHTVSNHQYQSKGIGGGYGGGTYMNPYESSSGGPMSSGSTGPSSVTDYVSKNSYGSSSTGGPSSNSAKGSTSSTGTGGSSQQSTDMSSSIYGGNKGHSNKMNTYDKPGTYGGSSNSSYSNLGQSSNPMGGSGAYGVYMPPQPDNASGQRQSGQPKPGSKQYGSQQQYWNSN